MKDTDEARLLIRRYRLAKFSGERIAGNTSTTL